jgi:O-6-methylguanine DNA methyltransferase
MAYGLTMICLSTFSIEPKRWMAIAIEPSNGKLVACTSSTSSGEAARASVLNTLRRLRRWNEVDVKSVSSNTKVIGTRLGELFLGNGKPFQIEEIAQKNWSLARITISQKLLEVPRGKVISYGGLARLTGSSPRGVGSVMASNPVPWAIPCHRVIHSNSRLGKFGRSISGTKDKERILRAEGVPFNTDSTVDSKAIFA